MHRETSNSQSVLHQQYSQTVNPLQLVSLRSALVQSRTHQCGYPHAQGDGRNAEAQESGKERVIRDSSLVLIKKNAIQFLLSLTQRKYKTQEASDLILFFQSNKREIIRICSSLPIRSENIFLCKHLTQVSGFIISS